jgi:hypothetical protein
VPQQNQGDINTSVSGMLPDNELTFNNLTITFSLKHNGTGSSVQPFKSDIKKLVSNSMSS